MNVNGHPVSFVMLVSVRLHNHTQTASRSISSAFQQVWIVSSIVFLL